LAGGIQLLRVGGQQESSKVLTTGEPGKAGDVSVTLLSSTANDSTYDAVVRIGGIDDPDGLKGFTLVGPGTVEPVTASTCTGISVAPLDCTLTFVTTGMPGTSRQMIFHRADQQLRWVLAQHN
jgi:hypothetical protein